MVTIRVDFLRGQFVGAGDTAAAAPEWPPAPARLLGALVATAYELALDPTPLTALESAPEVRFGDAVAATGGINYVPAAFIGSKGRPNRDIRRPQMVSITEPVYYHWPVAVIDPVWLRRVLRGVTYLGRAESSVMLTLADALPELPHHLAPDPQGEELLRAPEPGWLATLQAYHGSPARIAAPRVAYADPRVSIAPSPWGELFSLRTQGGELRDTAALGDALRRAAMSQAPVQMSAVLHGHAKVPHAAWLTLPDVGHRQASGRVLGVGMLLPRDVADEVCTEAVAALSQVDHLTVAGRRLGLRRPGGHERVPQGLQRRTWALASTTWATTTPLVLERHPRRGQAVESLVADTCERWGYPRPDAVEISQYSPVRGAPVARRFAPRRPGRWTHAVVHWDSPIRGPVLLGRDQHYGLGLCRPIRPQTASAAVAA
jgi:CRISPR-associated protein Csb2